MPCAGDVVGQSLSSASSPCPTTGRSGGIHPGRGDVMGRCQVARAAAGMAGSHPGAATGSPSALRHTGACPLVSHCNG